ncbi:hypothetical protein MANES_14G096902v8 [Manihot esculenta]|uniref:Uncharacterized protein n=1 Tax=Manihot esculenta TaxID=3983 RepID=A0ACB7GFF6_MANES|nr:hypothetical protein MANES_14G096902v8 [Manihot esculenta]
MPPPPPSGLRVSDRRGELLFAILFFFLCISLFPKNWCLLPLQRVFFLLFRVCRFNFCCFFIYTSSHRYSIAGCSSCSSKLACNKFRFRQHVVQCSKKTT